MPTYDLLPSQTTQVHDTSAIEGAYYTYPLPSHLCHLHYNKLDASLMHATTSGDAVFAIVVGTD